MTINEHYPKFQSANFTAFSLFNQIQKRPFSVTTDFLKDFF
ncbi:hypothetical protein THIOSC15_3560004 [uncultured Thiomicrorhabdus sp.]